MPDCAVAEFRFMAKPLDAGKLRDARFEGRDVVLVFVVKDGLEVLAERRGVDRVFQDQQRNGGRAVLVLPWTTEEIHVHDLALAGLGLGKDDVCPPGDVLAHDVMLFNRSDRGRVKKLDISHNCCQSGGVTYKDSKKCFNQIRPLMSGGEIVVRRR